MLRGQKFGIFGTLGLVALLAVGSMLAWLGYGWYVDRQIQQTTAACEMSRKSGNWKQLEQQATQLRSLQPSHGQPLLLLAESAEMQGQIQKAADLLGEFPVSDVRAPLVLAQKASLEWGPLNQPLQALKTSEELIRLRPRTTSSHGRIISFYAMTLQRPELLAAIRRAISMDAEPRETYAYLMMADALTFSNAIDLNAHWLSSDPNSSFFQITVAVMTANSLSSRVASLLTPENEEAARQARQSVEVLQRQHPSNPILLGFLLEKCIQDGDVSRTEELLRQVASENSNDHLLWSQRGWYHTLRGEFEAAETSFKTALSLHPMSWHARRNYVTLLRRQQKLEEVEKLTSLVATGLEIRVELLKLPNAREIPEELLKRIVHYADSCGDTLIRDALQKRLAP